MRGNTRRAAEQMVGRRIELREGIGKLGLLAVMGLTCLVAGCVGPAVQDAVEISRNVQYEEIPVPFGFDYDRGSWAYEQFIDDPVCMRSCEFTYWGDRPIKEVASWYEEQMPLSGWTLSRAEQAGDIALWFSKGHEEARINLKRTVNARREGYITKLTTSIGAL